MNKRALIDFLLTLVLLGVALLLAITSRALAASDGLAAAAVAVAALALAVGGGIYIVPRLARRVSWEWASQLRTHTAVTSEGIVFLVLVVIVGVAAWNTENNLLYLILSAMLAFIVVSGNIARQTLRDLSVRLRFPDHIFAGEPARVTVTLANQKRLLPSCSVGVEAHAQRDEGARDRPERSAPPRARRAKRRADEPLRLAHFIVVPARASVKQIVEHTFEKRGRYRIDGFTLVTRFPSGFFRKWRRVGAEGEVVVYPVPRPVDDLLHSLPILAGAVESHARGEGVDLYGLRDYRQSDHLRHIDWKASAKTRRVMVRETLHEEERRLSIFFDPRRPDVGDEGENSERFERAVERAASLAQHFIQEGAEVEFAGPNVRVAAGAGRAQLFRILGELAVLTPTRMPDPDDGGVAWDLLELLPGLGDDHRYKVLITSAHRGAIPGRVWRTSHVIFIDDL
jgi:uncharacterized protein (DUF58 family)